MIISDEPEPGPRRFSASNYEILDNRDISAVLLTM